MADGVKQVLARPIQLADQVTKTADHTEVFKQECQDLKSRAERLAALLRQAARSDLYEQPARRIMDDTEQVLERALALVSKCREQSFLTRVFNIVPANAFKKMTLHLDNSIGDVSWLLRASRPSAAANAADDDDDGYLGLPPIAANEPALGLIWEHVAKLQTGSQERKAESAAQLSSLAANDRYCKLIIEEGGVAPLLKLMKEGRTDGQESAAHALALLGRDRESVEAMVQAGACSAFAAVLKEGTMKVQAVAASAMADFAGKYPKCQDLFAQNNAVRYLVSHLAFETVEEHSKYTVHPRATSMHSVVQSTMAAKSSPGGTQQQQQQQPKLINANGSGGGIHHRNMPLQQNTAIVRGRELEDAETKAHMKAMAARALSQLAWGNPSICKSITESRALLCFAVLLEKGPENVQNYSAMAVMEIAKVAEDDDELRHTAFKPTATAAKAVVDQLLRIVEKGEYSDLLIAAIVALGCLSRTFRASETRIIGPLVRLLDDREPEVMEKTAIALTKFACTANYHHSLHSKAILAAGGARHLVQLVYFGSRIQIPALVLLCYIARAVPDSEDLAAAGVLSVLDWASKQSSIVQEPDVDSLLPAAKTSLQLYQSRGSVTMY